MAASAARNALAPLALALAALACGEPPRPPIVLLSLDTLRADHLAAYGYARETAPELSRFATEAVRFEEAIAQSSGTLPSHLSLLTSLSPPWFRITRAEDRHATQMSTGLRLPETVPTLSGALRDHGYETAAFTDGAFMSERYGFGHGFDHFNANRYSRDKSTRGLFFTLHKLEAFLDEREARPAGSSGPLFLFLHSYDVHEPYEAPPPFERHFGDHTHAELERELGFPPSTSNLNRHIELAARHRDRVVDLYDNGIAAADAYLGELFALLRARGLYDDAIVVVLSDHGEEFLEHGRFGHGRSVHRELVRVPLWIRLPGAREAGRSLARPVPLIDVAPTLLELAGVSSPDSFEGRSLVPAMRGDDAGADDERRIYYESPNMLEGAYGLQQGRWKVVRRHGSREVALYDLERDPAERENRAAREAERLVALTAALDAWVESMERRGRERGWWAVEPGDGDDAGDVAPRIRDQLRALGYVE